MFDLPVCLKKRGGPFAIVWTFGTDKKAVRRFNEDDILKVDLKNITIRIIECIPVFNRSHNVFVPETMLSLAAIAKMILGCCRINLYHSNKIVLDAQRYLENLEDPHEAEISPFESEVEGVRGDLTGDEAMPEFEPIPQPDFDFEDIFDEMEGAPPSPHVDIDTHREVDNIITGKKPRAPKKNPKRACRNRGQSVDTTDDELGQPKRKKRAPRKPKLPTVPEEPPNDNTIAVGGDITAVAIPTAVPLIEDVENQVYDDGEFGALDDNEMGNFDDFAPLVDDINATNMPPDETTLAGNAMGDEPMDLDAPFDPDAGAGAYEFHAPPPTAIENNEVIITADSGEPVVTVVSGEPMITVVEQGKNLEHVIIEQRNDNSTTFIVDSRFDSTNNVETARRDVRASSVASYSGPADLTHVQSEPNKSTNVDMTTTSHLEMADVPQLDYMSERSESPQLLNHHETLLTVDNVNVSVASSVVDQQVVMQDSASELGDQADQSTFIIQGTPKKRRILKPRTPRTKKDPRAAKVDRDKRCWAKIRKNAITLVRELKNRDANRDYEEDIEWAEGFDLPAVFPRELSQDIAESRRDTLSRSPFLEIDDIPPLDDADLFNDIVPDDNVPPTDEFQPQVEVVDDANAENPPVDEPFDIQPFSPMSSRYSSPEPVPVRDDSLNPASQDLFTSQMSESEDSEAGLLTGGTYFLADHLKDVQTNLKFAEFDINDEPNVINLAEEDIYHVLLANSFAKKKVLFTFKELFGHFDVHLKAFMFQALTLLAGKERLLMRPGDNDDDLQFCLAPDTTYIGGMKKLMAHSQRTGWVPEVGYPRNN